MLRIAGVLLAAWFLVVVMAFAFQEKLIFPGAATKGRADADVRAPENAEIVSLRTSGGERVVALFGKAETRDPARAPTILFFYGNGMSLAGALAEFHALRALGANVLIPDYVGYGMSSGSPSEGGCYATADAAFDWLRARGDIDADRIVAAGWSLGAAVAVDLAARRPVQAVMMFSAFTSLADVGREHYPFLPVRWLLRHRFESETKLASLRVPLLLVHGALDALVPYAMSERLRDAARASPRVALVPVPGVEHGDFFGRGDAIVYGAVREFLASLER